MSTSASSWAVVVGLRTMQVTSSDGRRMFLTCVIAREPRAKRRPIAGLAGRAELGTSAVTLVNHR